MNKNKSLVQQLNTPQVALSRSDIIEAAIERERGITNDAITAWDRKYEALNEQLENTALKEVRASIRKLTRTVDHVWDGRIRVYFDPSNFPGVEKCRIAIKSIGKRPDSFNEAKVRKRVIENINFNIFDLINNSPSLTVFPDLVLPQVVLMAST